MNFYKIEKPTYTLIAANNAQEAYGLYKDIVATEDEDVSIHNFNQVTERCAIAYYSRIVTPRNPNGKNVYDIAREIEESFNISEPQILAVGGIIL